MSSDTVKTVRDFVSLVRGTTYKGDLVGRPGPALLGLGSIYPGGGFRETDFKTYGGDCPEKLMLAPGDLFASLKGATKDGKMIGSVARVPDSVASGRLTQDTVKLQFLRPNKGMENYLYWVLRTPQYRDYCAGRAMGSAVVAMSREDFLSFEVPPVTSFRLATVDLLEELEKRERLLRETNATLEAIAQALFKSWFVDFDPVRAKAEGRSPDGMSDATAALFPDGFEESELGLVPRGWVLSTIGEAVMTVGGATPDTKNDRFWQPAEHCWTSPKDLSGSTSPVMLDTERRISSEGLDRIGSGMLPRGTLLMSSRAPIGYLALTAVPVAINQGYIAMPPGSRLAPLYMYFWCKHNMNLIKDHANGSTFMEISKRAFRPIELIVPPDDVAKAFLQVAEPLFERIEQNERQAQTLATLRDTLLPRLISGQLRLPEVNAETMETLV